MMDARYLFPFEKIKKCSRILIYGAGELGQAYLMQMLYTNYCTVVGFVDRNYKRYSSSVYPVYSIESIDKLDFDYLIIAVKSKSGLSEVYRVLEEKAVPERKIVYVGVRKEIDVRDKRFVSVETDDMSLAFEKKGFSIALMLLSAMGGLFFIKKFIMALVKKFPDCIIDIYVGGQIDAVKCFYNDIKNINMIVPNLGSRYPYYKDKYHLSLQVNSSGYLLFDYCNKEKIESININYLEFVNELEKKVNEEKYDDTIPRIALFQDRKFHNQNCYTSFDYGLFDINDKKITVPLDESAFAEFKKLNLGIYITINCGNGSCKDGSRVAKTWPIEHYIKFVSLFKEKYPNISIVQLGAKDAVKIDGVDKYLLGKSYELVVHVLKESILHVDIEGGLVHIASQLGTKCVVLFGPTPEFYYGYDENINIKVGDCHDCCGVFLDSNRCARGLDEPECMYSIKPENVMGKVEKCLLEKGFELK